MTTNYLDILPEELHDHIDKIVKASCVSDVMTELLSIQHDFTYLDENYIASHSIDYSNLEDSIKYLTIQRNDNILSFETEKTVYVNLSHTIIDSNGQELFSDDLSVYIQSLADNNLYKINFH
tara:strand:+ start:357 stop:722 length:366 start_codon:yes stop_codon:yes gene_type:complete